MSNHDACDVVVPPRSRRRMKTIAAFYEWIAIENWSGLLRSLGGAT